VARLPLLESHHPLAGWGCLMRLASAPLPKGKTEVRGTTRFFSENFLGGGRMG
jgi:hypothetical protein